MASPSPVQEWIPKAEAAALLGVSTREIERKAASGRVATTKVRLEGERSDRTVYSTEDLRRVKEEREAGAIQLAPRQIATPMVQEGALAALVTALRPPAAPQSKAWLTVEEAAEYSGLPAATIVETVRGGFVFALGRGLKTWRVQRTSLDHWNTGIRGVRSYTEAS